MDLAAPTAGSVRRPWDEVFRDFINWACTDFDRTQCPGASADYLLKVCFKALLSRNGVGHLTIEQFCWVLCGRVRILLNHLDHESTVDNRMPEASEDAGLVNIGAFNAMDTTELRTETLVEIIVSNGAKILPGDMKQVKPAAEEASAVKKNDRIKLVDSKWFAEFMERRKHCMERHIGWQRGRKALETMGVPPGGETVPVLAIFGL